MEGQPNEVIGWFVQWSPTVIVALIAAVVAWRSRNRDTQDRKEPTWVELSKENRDLRAELDETREELRALSTRFDQFVEEVRTRDRATARVLSDAAFQWPAEHEGPVFDAADIQAIEDAIPPRWRNRLRPAM